MLSLLCYHSTPKPNSNIPEPDQELFPQLRLQLKSPAPAPQHCCWRDGGRRNSPQKDANDASAKDATVKSISNEKTNSSPQSICPFSHAHRREKRQYLRDTRGALEKCLCIRCAKAHKCKHFRVSPALIMSFNWLLLKILWNNFIFRYSVNKQLGSGSRSWFRVYRIRIEISGWI